MIHLECRRSWWRSKGSKRFGLGVVILGEGLGGIVVVTLGERLLGSLAQ